MIDGMSRAAAERRAEQGYALADLTPADPPTLYDTGEAVGELENADVRHAVGQMQLTTDDVADTLVYPIVQRDVLKLVVETERDGDSDAYAATTVVVEPDDAREIAAAIWQAAEDVEQLRPEEAGD